MSADQSLAELICSPMDLLEEIILNENSPIEDLEQILPVLDDIINSSKSLYSTLVNRIKRIKFMQLSEEVIEELYNIKYYPIFYPKGEKIIENKYMMTKFYGLPFMRQRESWPKDEKEIPLKFLCQILHPEEPNILYRFFMDNGNKMTILPINLTTAKWLKGTSIAFKEIPYNSNECIIRKWVPYKELKEYKYFKEYISEEDYAIIKLEQRQLNQESRQESRQEFHQQSNPTTIFTNIHFGKKYLLQLEENNILLI